MKKKWSTLFYIIIVAGLGTVIYWIVEKGHALQTPVLKQQAQTTVTTVSPGGFTVFKDSFAHNLTDPLAILLLQIIVIIGFARFFGFLFKKIGQPAVIGEIVAGIVLGPSIIGFFS